MTELSALDQLLVERLVAATHAAGPESVASAIATHERMIANLLVRRDQLAADTQANERAIAMREWALIHLHANPEGAT